MHRAASDMKEPWLVQLSGHAISGRQLRVMVTACDESLKIRSKSTVAKLSGRRCHAAARGCPGGWSLQAGSPILLKAQLFEYFEGGGRSGSNSQV